MSTLATGARRRAFADGYQIFACRVFAAVLCRSSVAAALLLQTKQRPSSRSAEFDFAARISTSPQID